MNTFGIREGIAVVAGLVIVAGFVFVNNRPATDDVFSDAGNPSASVLGSLSGLAQGNVSDLVVRDLAVGNGEEAVEGKELSVHYIGLLPDGTTFDNSVERGEPFVFTLGSGQVIEGWDQGLLGMREGGRRVLVIPSELGYGSRGTPNIPPDSTLIFEVLLLEVN